MENKELATTKKITQGLVGNWLLWGMAFGIVYGIVNNLITHFIKSMIIQIIIAIAMQGIIAFLIWKVSTKVVFRNKTISKEEVPAIMKNLTIFMVVICIINGIYKFYLIREEANYEYSKSIMSSFSSYLYNYTDEENSKYDYNKQREEAMVKAKKQKYYLTAVEIGATVAYLAVLPLEKKEILKYVSY